MKVLVTGGTGFVGAHTVVKLLDDGHEVRLLVRRPIRLATTLGAIGIDIDDLDVVVGDMVDADAVGRAVKGVDATIHAAAVVAALNRAEAQRALTVNLDGTRTVIDAALAAGCDPVVHVSSIAAVFSPGLPIIDADLPPMVDAANPYTRSKALAEELARKRQAEGAPVVIVSPGGVCGPPVGEVIGDAALGFESMLKMGCLVFADGGINVIDARDLAAVLEATLQPGRGPRRYIAGGHLVRLPEVAAVIRQMTGRRFPVLPLPASLFRGLGHVLDGIRRVVPFNTVFTAEAMQLLTRATITDDAAVHDDLGVGYRAAADSIEASVRGLRASGRLADRYAGTLSR
ncbi:MAG TPA: NAD-dependent epimerase/dehydratase family protein [Mycobacteriales bacterium]|nr:NAD-dependent epimerase/dehydratase family protein [Mycobacteriales bacterium]